MSEKSMIGTWTLVAPDGREYKAENPLKCCKAERDERIPAIEQLENMHHALFGICDLCDGEFAEGEKTYIMAKDTPAEIGPLCGACYGSISADVGKTMETKTFPLCGTGKSIPLSIAEKAYEEYVKKFGRVQTLERLGERGGFWPNELDELYPQWREHVEEIYMLRKEIETLQSLVSHPGDGSCERCGSAPATSISLCEPCKEVEDLAESKIREIRQAIALLRVCVPRQSEPFTTVFSTMEKDCLLEIEKISGDC